MEFAELIKDIKNVKFEALRKDSDDFFEAVVIRSELAGLTGRLEKFFGMPVCPSKDKVSPPVQEVINGFGGIRPNQTLYFWGMGKEVIFAMLWPWQDGGLITIKIIRICQ